jgi:hypothetical protein
VTATETRLRPTRLETVPERIVRLALQEKGRAEEVHGVNSWPLGTGSTYWQSMANLARLDCQQAFAEGRGTWLHISREEVFEAFAEEDPVKFVQEALQAIGTFVAAIEDVVKEHGSGVLPPPF